MSPRMNGLATPVGELCSLKPHSIKRGASFWRSTPYGAGSEYFILASSAPPNNLMPNVTRSSGRRSPGRHSGTSPGDRPSCPSCLSRARCRRRRPNERRAREPAGRASAAARSPRRSPRAGRVDHPQHHEVAGALVDDLVSDVVTEHARGVRHERMTGAVNDDAPLSAEADLELDLVPCERSRTRPPGAIV